MNCPLCIDQTLMPNYRAGIEIDVCPKCKGVWLDRGELDKLAKPGDLAPPPVQDTLRSSASTQAGKSSEKKSGKKSKKKKKKSSLDRLGDILEDVLDL